MATEAWLAAVELTSQGHQRHDVGHLGEARTEAVGPPAVERRSVEFLGELAKQAVDEREARVAVLSSRRVHHGEQKLRLVHVLPTDETERRAAVVLAGARRSALAGPSLTVELPDDGVA